MSSLIIYKSYKVKESDKHGKNNRAEDKRSGSSYSNPDEIPEIIPITSRTIYAEAF